MKPEMNGLFKLFSNNLLIIFPLFFLIFKIFLLAQKYYYNPFNYQESQEIVPPWRNLLHGTPGDQCAAFQGI